MRKRVQRAEAKGRLTELERAAKAFEDFRPAHEVFKRVRAVPTCFVQYDHGVGVGGHPLERFGIVHGPSNEGKTLFLLGLAGSFLQRNHPVLWGDAERTTAIDWPEKLLGPLARHPLFFALRPETYEETVDTVRRFLLRVRNSRASGKLAADTTALVVIDSLKKLVPANIWKQVEADAKKNGIDGVGGAAGRLKAALNAQWLDELTPLLDDTGTSMLAIAREREDPNADKWARMAGRDYVVGGGKAIYFDSSLAIRVERASWVTDGGDDKGQNKKVFGERHRLTIRKTKVAGKEDKQVICYFHSSNGTLVPFGFDRARDVLELGERFGLVEKKGAWFSFKGVKIGQGINETVKRVTNQPEILAGIEGEVRANFVSNKPTEIDDDGVLQEG